MNVNFRWKPWSAVVSASILALTSASGAQASATNSAVPRIGAGSTANSSDASADDSNPYAIITDRNVFRLNPIPPPPAVEVKPADLPKINLNGFVKIRDITRVLFSIPPKDAKQDTAYYSLALGEKQGILELVKIHPEKGEVDILNSGTPMTLSLASNSVASGGGRGPAPGPGFGGRRMPNMPTPVRAQAAPAAASAIVVGGGSDYGAGGVTVGGGSSASVANNSPYSGVSVAGGSPTTGSSGVGNQLAGPLFPPTYTPTGNTQIGNPAPLAPVSPDVQAATLLLQHTQSPSGPPLPPSLAALVGEGSGGQGASGPPPVP
jgi:hypothetical protein